MAFGAEASSVVTSRFDSVISPAFIILFTLVLFPDGRTVISSPTFILPAAIVPQKPLKSRFGRFTY